MEPENSSFGNYLLLGKAMYSLVYPCAPCSGTAPGLTACLEEVCFMEVLP